MKIGEYKQVNGKMKLVTREMTAEEIAELEALRAEEPTQKTDALTEMVTAMSTATTIAQMRNAAKEFLSKTERMQNL